MRTDNLKDDTMNEIELQRVYSHAINSRDSEIYSDKGFVIIDDRPQGGTHWVYFIGKTKSYYFDSFGVQIDKFLPNQLPKPIIHQNFEKQVLNS